VAAAHARWLASRAWPACPWPERGAAHVAVPEPPAPEPATPINNGARTSGAHDNGARGDGALQWWPWSLGPETIGRGSRGATGAGAVRSGSPPSTGVRLWPRGRRALLYDVTAAFIGLASLGPAEQKRRCLILGRQAGNSNTIGSYAAISVASKALVFGALALGSYLLPEATIRWNEGATPSGNWGSPCCSWLSLLCCSWGSRSSSPSSSSRCSSRPSWPPRHRIRPVGSSHESSLLFSIV